MQELKECLCCKNSDLYKYLDLGLQPLANNLKDSVDEPDELYPLALNVCKHCFHSQLTISVEKDKLFKNYLYVSGTSKSLREYFKFLAEKIIRQTGFQRAKILDVACNDGTFLEFFKPYKWDIWGVDPALNLREISASKGVKIIPKFFPCDLGNKFDVITGLNVLAHTDTPYAFLVGCKRTLRDGGYIYIQTSQKDMVVNGEFDTVYHEHQSFFTIKSMEILIKRAGLFLENVEVMDVHGGSYLFTIRKEPTEVKYRLEGDNRYSLATYFNFQNKVQIIKNELKQVVNNLDMPIVGYGAAAKGVVILNYAKMPVEYVVDDNPLKQGRIIGGVNIPIYNSEKLKNDNRDLAIVIFAWNIYEDIMANIRKVRNQADKFIRPFPRIEVI